MPVIFKANIQEDENLKWSIKLTDTTDNSEQICNDLKDFFTKLEQMGADYGSDIEMQWSKDVNVSDDSFKQIHNQMAKYKEEVEDINK
jgi:hypothetical protein